MYSLDLIDQQELIAELVECGNKNNWGLVNYSFSDSFNIIHQVGVQKTMPIQAGPQLLKFTINSSQASLEDVQEILLNFGFVVITVEGSTMGQMNISCELLREPKEAF